MSQLSAWTTLANLHDGIWFVWDSAIDLSLHVYIPTSFDPAAINMYFMCMNLY